MSEHEPGFLHQAPGAAADPGAELDELLAAALPCTPAVEGSVAAKACAAGSHWPGCPGAYRSALRRCLAAWLATQKAEAELRRRALDGIREAAEHYCDDRETGYLEGFAATAWEQARAALARPRPSASGLLELLGELRQDQQRSEAKRDAASRERVAILGRVRRRLAAELGLEEEGDAV